MDFHNVDNNLPAQTSPSILSQCCASVPHNLVFKYPKTCCKMLLCCLTAYKTKIRFKSSGIIDSYNGYKNKTSSSSENEKETIIPVDYRVDTALNSLYFVDTPTDSFILPWKQQNNSVMSQNDYIGPNVIWTPSVCYSCWSTTFILTLSVISFFLLTVY